MHQTPSKSSFIQLMDAQLLQYQLEKAQRQDNKVDRSQPRYQQERAAKDALMEMDD